MPVFNHQVEGLIQRLRSRATEPGVAMRWKEDFLGAADMLEDIQRDGVTADPAVPVERRVDRRPPTPGMGHSPDDINPDTGHPYGEATPAAGERSYSHESNPAPGKPYVRDSVDPVTGQRRDPVTGQPFDQTLDGAKLDLSTGRPKSAGVVNTTRSMKADADDTGPKATKKA